MSWAQLKSLLRLKARDGWHADRKVEKNGLRGNDTYARIAIAFGEEPVPEGLLDFPLTDIPADPEKQGPALLFDPKSGEVLCEESRLCVAPEVEQSPLYRSGTSSTPSPIWKSAPPC